MCLASIPVLPSLLFGQETDQNTLQQQVPLPPTSAGFSPWETLTGDQREEGECGQDSGLHFEPCELAGGFLFSVDAAPSTRLPFLGFNAANSPGITLPGNPAIPCGPQHPTHNWVSSLFKPSLNFVIGERHLSSAGSQAV